MYKEEEYNGFKSEMTFGYYDKTKYEGELKWFPVTKQHFFAFKLDDLLFNGKSYGICKNRPEGCLMTIDSGLSYMVIPPYVKQTMDKNNILVSTNCDPKTQLGNITLVIGG